MAINQITTSNTFQQWLTATQSLIAAANDLTDGNGATFIANTILQISGSGSSLNVKTSGEINALYSNTIDVKDIVTTNVGADGIVTISGVGSSLNVDSSAEINTLYSNTIDVKDIVTTNVDADGIVTISGTGSSLNVRTSADVNELYANTSVLNNVSINNVEVSVFGSITEFFSNTATIIDLDVSNVSIDLANITTVNSVTSISDIFKIDDTAYFTESAGGVYLAFDTNDYLSYNRSLNRVNLFINANNVIEIDSNATFSINGNTHLKVPVGTTAQRDAAATPGSIRYNSTIGAYEGYSALGWTSIGGGFNDAVTINTNTNADPGKLYVLTANVTVTLPASPSVGNFVGISNLSGYANSVIARNSTNIMGLAEDMNIDSIYAGFTLYYTGAAKGWVIL